MQIYRRKFTKKKVVVTECNQGFTITVFRKESSSRHNPHRFSAKYTRFFAAMLLGYYAWFWSWSIVMNDSDYNFCVGSKVPLNDMAVAQEKHPTPAVSSELKVGTFPLCCNESKL